MSEKEIFKNLELTFLHYVADIELLQRWQIIDKSDFDVRAMLTVKINECINFQPYRNVQIHLKGEQPSQLYAFNP